MIIEIHYAQEYKVIDLSCDADDEKKNPFQCQKYLYALLLRLIFSYSRLEYSLWLFQLKT